MPSARKAASADRGGAAIAVPRAATPAGGATSEGGAAIAMPRPATPVGSATTENGTAIAVPRPATPDGGATSESGAAIAVPMVAGSGCAASMVVVLLLLLLPAWSLLLPPPAPVSPASPPWALRLRLKRPGVQPHVRGIEGGVLLVVVPSPEGDKATLRGA